MVFKHPFKVIAGAWRALARLIGREPERNGKYCTCLARSGKRLHARGPD